MENTPLRKRWSDLHHLALVDLNAGKKLGTWSDFYFDSANGPTLNHVFALRIKTGMLSYQILPVTAINTIGDDAITTVGENQLVPEKADKEITALPLGENLQSYKIMSEGGTLVGTVGNILLDITNPGALYLAAFELGGGLRSRISGRYPTFTADKILSYGHDVIVIPDAIASEL